MKISKSITEDEAKQLALLRFSIIAPVVNNTHTFKSQMAFFRDAALKEYILPSGKKCTFKIGTIKNWYTAYKNYGFDALKNEYGDLIKKGILDPTKVTRSALVNAASVSATLLTTEALVVEVEDKKNKAER